MHVARNPYNEVRGLTARWSRRAYRPCYVSPRRAAQRGSLDALATMLKDFASFRAKPNVYGIERLFVSAILLLRLASSSYWFRSYLPSARGDRRWVRDNAIDLYCVVQVLALVVLLVVWARHLFAVWIGAYILFDLFLVLANVIFVGKFPDLQARPASIERTIILLLLNVLVVVFAFAIFYRYTLRLGISSAVFHATLVLGTVGYATGLQGSAQLLIACQIGFDLILTVLLLSSFVGQLGLFRRD